MNTVSPLAAPVYTADQVRRLDACAIQDAGIPGYQLMCRAAEAAYTRLRTRWPQRTDVRVVCGTGNNGGDGFVIARLAAADGLRARVLLAGDVDRIVGDARVALTDARSAGVSVEPFPAEIEAQTDEAICVDALLGTGLQGLVRESQAAAIAAINASGLPVMSVDIPSGLCSDTGVVRGCAVRAELTVTFIGRKQGMYTGEAADYCGEIQFEDLSVPDWVYDRVVPDAALLRRTGLAPRPRTAHKGQAGHVLVVGGDHGMGGAALLAAQAAGRCGAGLVSLATREPTVVAANARCPEVMARAVNTVPELESMLERASLVVVGPGLGRSAWSGQMLYAALRGGIPAVLDADALNLIAGLTELGEGQRILTPHPGEAGRLLGVTTAEVASDRFAAVRALATRYRAVVVLKGSGSLVAAPQEPTGICTAGNPGMASGGMGDVLSGVIGALWAQGLTPYSAASEGVCLHADAADRAALEEGERGLLASDLLHHFRRLVNGARSHD